MIGISLVVALLEISGIGILLHTILSLLKPTFVTHNIFTSFAYKTLGLADQKTFILIITSFLFLAYLVKNVLLVQLNKLQVKWAYEITSTIANQHYKHIAKKNMRYFHERKSADIVNEIMAVSLSFTDSILLASIMLISEFFIIVLLLTAILVYNPLLFLFSFASIIPIAAFLIYLNKNKLANQGKSLHALFPAIYENVTELTSGIAQMKLWNSTNQKFEQYATIKNEIYELNKSVYIKSHYVPPRIYEVVAISGILCVVLYGVLDDIGASAIISYISIYAGVSFRLLPSMNRIISTSNILAINSHILNFVEGLNRQENENEIACMPFEKSLELRDIRFGYSPKTTVFDALNLTIKKGQFVGLTGNSGAGKSTLVNVLCALLDAQKGSVLVDGDCVTQNQKQAYQYLFSYVKQDVFMLNSSILNNVAFLDDQPDEAKAMSCLEKVNLLDWIATLPNGMYTSVGEVGKQISGGQRQRIAIARALYKDTSVFIFDEVTNNLDTQSKIQTLATIEVLKKEGKTAIFITHNTKELELCNSVYTLKNKRLDQIR